MPLKWLFGIRSASHTQGEHENMALTLESAARLLDRHGLLREIIRGDVWTLDPHDIKGFDEPFSAITYDTRKVEPGTFLCCKGRFKAEYLQGIDERGLAAYVS